MINPEFPAKLKITRNIEKGDYPNQTISEEIILLTRCGYRNLTAEDVKTADGAYISDHKLSMPRHHKKINKRDMVEVTDINGIVRGIVIQSKIGNARAYLWFNEV